MARWQAAPIVGGAYSDDTRPWSVQDTVNLIPVYAEKEGTRSPKMLRCAPGYSDFVDLGTNAPIRGMRNVEGLLLVVSGPSLFSVTPKGRVTNLGKIPGVGRVIMSHNQITGGNQVAITPGYVYDTVKATLTKITDEGFPGAKSFDYIDSYITYVEPGGRFAGTSDLADAMSYNTLDQEEAESAPDKIVGQIISHHEWWLMGERTIEVFVKTGAATGTFQRSSGTGMDVGLASPYACANLDNSVFWLGNDGVVYRANGWTPVRISTHPIEQAISRCTTNTAFAFTFEDRGHKIFYLTFQDGQTWGYDVATQEWHRRQSKNLDRWRINGLVSWNGKWIAGDFSNGKLYTLDWDVQSEAGIEMERMRVTGVLSDSQNAVIVNAIELVFDTGQPQKEAATAPLTISGNAPDGYVGHPYSFAGYSASGGKPPYTFSLAAGSLPTGLGTINPATGGISGTPTNVSLYGFTPRVTDANGAVATLADSINIDVFVSYQDQVIADGAYVLWPLDDDTDTAVEVIRGLDGLYTGTGIERQVPSLMPGGQGAAARFTDRNDRVEVPNDTTLQHMQQPFTIEWLGHTLSDMPNGSGFFVFGSSSTSAVWALYSNPTQLILRRGNSGTDFYITPDGTFLAAQKHHFAFVARAPGAIEIYRDGVLLGSVPHGFDPSANNNPQPISIGGVTGADDDDPSARELQNVAVYLTDLSAAQIAKHYQLAQL